MNAEIFIPMFYMVLLTFTVSLIGTIVEIMVDNAEPVEFDQPLFVIE